MPIDSIDFIDFHDVGGLRVFMSALKKEFRDDLSFPDFIRDTPLLYHIMALLGFILLSLTVSFFGLFF